LVASIARPGGNITGMFLDLSELSGKHLQLLKEIIPRTSRVAVLGDLDINAPQLRELALVARSLALETQAVEFKNATNLDGAFDAAKQEERGGLIVIPTALNAVERNRIISSAARGNVPAMYAFRFYATDGGLMSYGIDTVDLFRRSASYVDRILKGEKPADLPVQAPTKFEMVINLKTAKALGLEIPPTIIARADEVIE
jgi:ABC-type uncharacterized transport system substrate-binding protein